MATPRLGAALPQPDLPGSQVCWLPGLSRDRGSQDASAEPGTYLILSQLMEVPLLVIKAHAVAFGTSFFLFSFFLL